MCRVLGKVTRIIDSLYARANPLKFVDPSRPGVTATETVVGTVGGVVSVDRIFLNDDLLRSDKLIRSATFGCG